MIYEADIPIETCKNSSRYAAKSVLGLFHVDVRPTSQIIKKAANNKVQRHSQAQTSYPAERSVPYGAEFDPWRCRIIANVFAKPQNINFQGLASFLRYLNHFCKSSVIYYRRIKNEVFRGILSHKEFYASLKNTESL